MKSEVTGIRERLKKARLGVKDTLAVIDMTLEDQLAERTDLSHHELFDGLNELIDKTIHGTTIQRFRPREGSLPFHAFEIQTERGEALGYLNMVYFRKPIPCYYLVYVEVLSPFRRRGLGNKILKTFRAFVESKGAVGLLDNIIPVEDPTYDIYIKLGWRDLRELAGENVINGDGHYMAFVPSSLRIPDLRDKLIQLLFKIRKKRPVIDMHDNESMVKRTIDEFRSVYQVLERLFATELSTGASTTLMCFMFTRFVTKMLGFRRRIASLLGYTGGESLDQITLSNRILNLPIQSFSLWGVKNGRAEMWGDGEIVRNLPRALVKDPTLYIEDLPLYRRPYLSHWLEQKGSTHLPNLRISDLLELGFDPTRLREFTLQSVGHIFERVSPHLIASTEMKQTLLLRIAEYAPASRFQNATLQINPPLLFIRDRGNGYILRRKVEGIHVEEALDQLRILPHLTDMNRAVGIDRVVLLTISEIREWLLKVFDSELHQRIEDLAFFIPWDLERNTPRVTVDPSSVYLDTIWAA